MVVAGDKILTGSVDRSIREWAVETGEEVTRYRGHEDTPLVLYEEGGTVYSAGCDLSVRAWRPSPHTMPHVPFYRDNAMDAQVMMAITRLTPVLTPCFTLIHADSRQFMRCNAV